MPPRPSSSISLYLPRKNDAAPGQQLPGLPARDQALLHQEPGERLGIAGLAGQLPGPGEFVGGEQVALFEDFEKGVSIGYGHNLAQTRRRRSSQRRSVQRPAAPAAALGVSKPCTTRGYATKFPALHGGPIEPPDLRVSLPIGPSDCKPQSGEIWVPVTGKRYCRFSPHGATCPNVPGRQRLSCTWKRAPRVRAPVVQLNIIEVVDRLPVGRAAETQPVQLLPLAGSRWPARERPRAAGRAA